MGTGGVFLRKLRAKVEDRPTGFVWVEDRSIAGSGYPASRSQVEWLARNGVGSILSLTEDPLPAGWVSGLGLVLGHIPMKDHAAPTIGDMERGAKFVKEQKALGKAVAVHCLAGEGRTGCVLSAYLIHTKGMGAAEAMAKLREFKPAFVEPQQEKAVFEFDRNAAR